MQNYPPLLRRPLPPKLPKLPLNKKVHTATTDKIEPPYAKFTHDETTLIERDATSFPAIVSRKQLQTSVHTQNFSLNIHVQTKMAATLILPKSPRDMYWNIPETATGSIFFPRCHSASTRVFGKETKQMERSRKPKEEPWKIEKTYVGSAFKDIPIPSSMESKPPRTPSPVIVPRSEDTGPQYSPFWRSRTPTPKHLPTERSTARSSISPRIMSAQARHQQLDHFQQNTAVLLSITNFPDAIFLPAPVLPRKPRRQTEIEIQVAENANLEGTGRQSMPVLHEGSIKPGKRYEKEDRIVRGEGFKTVTATQYETVATMANLAALNCQRYGRNALNLKGFFILNCPDLTPLAFQLIYLNLSFNDISSFPTEVFCLKHLQILILRNNPIKTIPSAIQQLKFLRVFNIAFNLIMSLPPGLFCLPHLEELNISYNSITFIPNEIQKLRSLKNLIVDGNELTSFPPGILKLNLKKIQLENNFTHPCFWKENSLNSPQSLIHVASLFFLKNNLHKYYDVIPAKIQQLLNCPSRCEWCQGPRLGEGYRVIQSCNVFGAVHLPVLFYVCSSSCYRDVRENSVF